MKERTISIFLNRDDVPDLEHFRAKYDSLYEKIPPHITLVFPFMIDWNTEQCIQHMTSSLISQPPFRISLKGTMLAEDGCLFVLIQDGRTMINELNDSLYSGSLNVHRSPEHEYIPHVTIGRFRDSEQAKAVQEEAAQLIGTIHLKVDKITLETIDEEAYSEIEYVHELV